MVVTELGRRERKRLQTRQALVDAAHDLFRQRGFDATTIEQITDAADVSPRTFFRYFATKEDVIFIDTEQRLADLADELLGRPAHEPILTSVREAMLALVHVFEDERDVLLLQAELAADSPSLTQRGEHAQTMLLETVAGYVADRLGVPVERDLRPGLVAGAVVAAVITAVRTWTAEGGSDDLGARVLQALELLDRGFGLPA